MELIKGLAKRVMVTVATAVMTLPGMAVGSALAVDAPADQWLKICRKDDKAKKELCQTADELRTNDGQFLASFTVVEMTGEARRMARVIMPTGMLLLPGLKVQIDQAKFLFLENVVPHARGHGRQAKRLRGHATVFGLKSGEPFHYIKRTVLFSTANWRLEKIA